MLIFDLDASDKQDEYVLFRDAEYIYIVHKDLSKRMQQTTKLVGGHARIFNSDIVIHIKTGTIIKSRFSPTYELAKNTL